MNDKVLRYILILIIVFMKHFLQQMKRDALAPPRRAWAMRHWALSLLLLVMLQFVGSTPKAQTPWVYDVHGQNFPGTLHVYFNFNFFCWDGDNGHTMMRCGSR